MAKARHHHVHHTRHHRIHGGAATHASKHKTHFIRIERKVRGMSKHYINPLRYKGSVPTDEWSTANLPKMNRKKHMRHMHTLYGRKKRASRKK